MVSTGVLVTLFTCFLLIPLIIIVLLTVFSLDFSQTSKGQNASASNAISKSSLSSSGLAKSVTPKPGCKSPGDCFTQRAVNIPSKSCKNITMSSSSLFNETCESPTTCFALDFGKAYEQASKNILMSPLGILMSYSMLLQGAHGYSKEQIMRILRFAPRFNSPEDVYIEFMKAIQKYNSSDENVRFILSNLAMVSNKVELNPDYTATLWRFYGTNVLKEDFAQGEEVKQKINEMISKETANMIPKLLDEPPEPDTVMVLINTIFFKGKWLKAFQASDTRRGTFFNSDGTHNIVDMMHLNAVKFPYVAFDDKKLKIIELSYHGDISMYILMPMEIGQLQNLVRDMTEEKLNSYLTLLDPMHFKIVSIPKFTLKQSYELHEILPEMGLCLPFSKEADFRGISNVTVKVTKSLQNSVVQIDEEGTVGAAATLLDTVFYSVDSMRIFILDHPFIFLLRDRVAHHTIFLGVVNNLPSK